MGLIYSASLFEPENHHGVLIPVCRSLPRKLKPGVSGALVKDHPLRDLVKPSAALLNAYKDQQKDWQAKLKQYREAGYEDPFSFVDHVHVCGSLQKALETPEPWQELGQSPEDAYTHEYREQLRPVGARLKSAVGALAESPEEYTVLCWERKGEFCHRNLLMQCVLKWRPDAFGGQDVTRKVEP